MWNIQPYSCCFFFSFFIFISWILSVAASLLMSRNLLFSSFTVTGTHMYCSINTHLFASFLRNLVCVFLHVSSVVWLALKLFFCSIQSKYLWPCTGVTILARNKIGLVFVWIVYFSILGDGVGSQGSGFPWSDFCRTGWFNWSLTSLIESVLFVVGWCLFVCGVLDLVEKETTWLLLQLRKRC